MSNSNIVIKSNQIKIRDDPYIQSIRSSIIIGYNHDMNYPTGSFNFNSLNDMIKTKNITAAEIRKVVGPIKLYNNPPTISPIMLARLPILLPTP